MQVGTVKAWDDLKGYGFIHAEGGDVFVHHSNIDADRKGRKNLTPGQVVQYESEFTSKGWNATRVITAGE